MEAPARQQGGLQQGLELAAFAGPANELSGELLSQLAVGCVAVQAGQLLVEKQQQAVAGQHREQRCAL
jgi:pyrimidine deaminase RibD-like protein